MEVSLAEYIMPNVYMEVSFAAYFMPNVHRVFRQVLILTASMAVILAVTAAAATAAAVGILLGHVGACVAFGGVTAWKWQNIQHKLTVYTSTIITSGSTSQTGNMS